MISRIRNAPLLGFYDIHMRNISRSWGYTPEFVMQAQLRCHPNYVVKMKDMGLDCQYIFKVISHLKGFRNLIWRLCTRCLKPYDPRDHRLMRLSEETILSPPSQLVEDSLPFKVVIIIDRTIVGLNS